MSYTKTNWVNGETPVNADNMNKIEDGIANALTKPDAVLSSNELVGVGVNGEQVRVQLGDGLILSGTTSPYTLKASGGGTQLYEHIITNDFIIICDKASLVGYTIKQLAYIYTRAIPLDADIRIFSFLYKIAGFTYNVDFVDTESDFEYFIFKSQYDFENDTIIYDKVKYNDLDIISAVDLVTPL